MYVFGKYYSNGIIQRIQEIISQSPDISRRELSRKICLVNNWYSSNGKLQEMGCRKALSELNRQGIIQLPEIKTIYSFQKKLTNKNIELSQINCQISELGEIKVEPISSRYKKDSKVWYTLLDKYHYLGSGKLCGSQLRYIVKSSKYGYIGAIGFNSGTRQLKARDQYIGWNERTRMENINRVISNTRFLIIPTVKVQNLASYIFSQLLSRIAEDWEKKYKVRPVLIESYVDPSRYPGTIYKASNWKYIGDSSGRRDGISKRIYIFELSKKWKEELCKESSKNYGEIPAKENPENWAEEEFGRVRFYDDRLKRRLYKVARFFYDKPQANIPEACGSKANTIGTYRFFKNKKVGMDVILDSHTEATIERIREHKVVLAPQDTTYLNYSTHPMTEGLGPISHIADKTIGLILHDTLALSEEGTPLGVLDGQCWARDIEEKGKAKRRKDLPVEQKESIKWLRSFKKLSRIQKLCPETMLISIGDRESDIYELFQEAVKEKAGPKLLVRSSRNSMRKVEEEYLWEYMIGQAVSGKMDIQIPRRGNRKSRIASMDIRFSEVQLRAPKRLGESIPVKLWAVYLNEPTEKKYDITPIEWMLITTVEVKDFEDASKVIKWYIKRWSIEVFHRTLKTGCRIKDRQLGNADSLEASLGIDMVVAWRIFHLTKLGREVPDSPCSIFFREEEWKALHCYTYKTKKVPKDAPKLADAIRMVGAIGGHLGRKSDGMPGTKTLWRGLQSLDIATEMYIILTIPSFDDS